MSGSRFYERLSDTNILKEREERLDNIRVLDDHDEHPSHSEHFPETYICHRTGLTERREGCLEQDAQHIQHDALSFGIRS